MTIGVVGSRRRHSSKDFRLVRAAVTKLYTPSTFLVSGGCPTGADNFAERIARELGATIVIHHANWTKHGKKAGFIRNTYIASDAKILIACVAPDRTGGTEDTIRKFLEKYNLSEEYAVRKGWLVLV